MEACLAQVSEAKPSENFWSLYWHKRWLDSPESLAHLHLSAYLQEVCYWSARKAAASFGGVQYKLSDFFQLAIAQVNRVLEKFNPDRGSTLKTYASATFSSMIRDALRQQKEISISTDWALLRQLSQKRLVESLQTTGLSSETIDRYKLAWR
jgi:RNA polymerase sigma factor (sigma-70 family)